MYACSYNLRMLTFVKICTETPKKHLRVSMNVSLNICVYVFDYVHFLHVVI